MFQPAVSKDELVRLAQREELRKEIEAALVRAGQAAAMAQQMRRAALAEIGELMRIARAAGDDTGDLVGPKRAEALTGLTRQTVALSRDDDDSWRQITETAAAAQCYEDKQERLETLYPHLRQITETAAYLRDQLDPDKPFDPFELEESPLPVQLLRELHAAQVARLAEGHPTAASDRLAYLYKQVSEQ